MRFGFDKQRILFGLEWDRPYVYSDGLRTNGWFEVYIGPFTITKFFRSFAVEYE